MFQSSTYRAKNRSSSRARIRRRPPPRRRAHHGKRLEREHDAPGAEPRPDQHDANDRADLDDIDREADPEGVHALRGCDRLPLAASKRPESSSPRRAGSSSRADAQLRDELV